MLRESLERRAGSADESVSHGDRNVKEIKGFREAEAEVDEVTI